jgi:hypothetical protein
MGAVIFFNENWPKGDTKKRNILWKNSLFFKMPNVKDFSFSGGYCFDSSQLMQNLFWDACHFGCITKLEKNDCQGANRLNYFSVIWYMLCRCSLGDVTLDDELYKKAWEVSGHRFARAQVLQSILENFSSSCLMLLSCVLSEVSTRTHSMPFQNNSLCVVPWLITGLTLTWWEMIQQQFWDGNCFQIEHHAACWHKHYNSAIITAFTCTNGIQSRGLS